MIEIRFENPKQEPLEKLADFKEKLTALGVDLQQREQSFTVTTQPGTLPEGTMGEPLSFSLIVAYVVAHQTEIVALTKLAVFLKAVRDLYVSFLSERKSERERTERPDKLIVSTKKITIELPTSDEEIDKFVKTL
jgi:hypothetical protein